MIISSNTSASETSLVNRPFASDTKSNHIQAYKVLGCWFIASFDFAKANGVAKIVLYKRGDNDIRVDISFYIRFIGPS